MTQLRTYQNHLVAAGTSAAKAKGEERTGDGSRRLRVLHVIDGLGPGGAENLLWRLVERPSEVEHHVVSLGAPDWYSDRIREAGIPLSHFRMISNALLPAATVALYRHIKRARPDVVQAWLYRSNAVASLAARAARVPVVWGIHCSSLEPLGPFAQLVVHASGKVAGRAANFIVNCSTQSAAVHARLGFNSAPGRVIPNGYDASTFRPDETARVATRVSLDLGPDTFVIGCVSRWNRFKDIPNLLRAIAIVREQGLPIRCLLIGRGLNGSNRELAAEIAESGCEQFALPLGERRDLPKIVQAFDVHVLPSVSEAFPNTVAETMLCGVPNIVTEVGDCALIVGDSGWLVPPQNSEKLADAIVAAWREWKGDSSCWTRRSARARRMIADRFAFDKMAEAYQQVWREVRRGHIAR